MLNLRFIAALLLVISAFVICVGGSLLTKNIENHLIEAVAAIDPAEEYDQIETAVRQLTELWDEKQHFLNIFLSHDQCGRIGSLVAQIRFYASDGDANALSLTCFQFLQFLEELREQENFSIYNLL